VKVDLKRLGSVMDEAHSGYKSGSLTTRISPVSLTTASVR